MRRGKVGAGLAGAAMMLLGGCAGRYLAVDDAGRTTAAPPRIGPVTPVAVAAPDTCGATRLQYLIGKPKQQIPVPVDLSTQRVDCTTCIMSHLDDPRRVTILYDQTSGLVTKVMCQ